MGAIEAQLSQVIESQREMRQGISKLTEAVQKLAVIEERQTNDRAATDRAFAEIRGLEDAVKGHDTRLKKLEESAPLNSMSQSIVFKAGAIILAAVVGSWVTTSLRPTPAPPPIMIQGAPAVPTQIAPAPTQR